jgi:hypothetical protein
VHAARLLTTMADTAALVFARASAADGADAVRTVFATALLAYGTDARDSVISAELVFIGHANILIWRFSAEMTAYYQSVKAWQLTRQGEIQTTARIVVSRRSGR